MMTNDANANATPALDAVCPRTEQSVIDAFHGRGPHTFRSAIAFYAERHGNAAARALDLRLHAEARAARG